MTAPMAKQYDKAEIMAFMPDKGRLYRYLFKRHIRLIKALAREGAYIGTIARALIKVEPMLSGVSLRTMYRHLVPYLNENNIKYAHFPSPNPRCARPPSQNTAPEPEPELITARELPETPPETDEKKKNQPRSANEGKEDESRVQAERERSAEKAGDRTTDRAEDEVTDEVTADTAAKTADRTQSPDTTEPEPKRKAKPSKPRPEAKTKPDKTKPAPKPARSRRKKEPEPQRTKEEYWKEGKAAPSYLFDLPKEDEKLTALPPPETMPLFSDWTIREAETEELREYYKTLKHEYDYLQRLADYRHEAAKTPEMKKLERDADFLEYTKKFDELWQNEFYYRFQWQKVRTRRIRAHLEKVEKEIRNRDMWSPLSI
ncbi:hypothetical protein [Hydrogenimonas cancrithermarum]|uniref:Uncharacterized protein n=1 Tax=Hydrogenimonas cancrithermarum TaxID=2993563 RepID=A0ABN6WXK3_9BACT|nr:hypothetical protein [Hydrogenimonas cancrithermarum]BDY13991.1 hypothetical protein HCR_23040 [Hydrogenimonas cancrithermarum]